MKPWDEMTREEQIELYVEKSETRHFSDDPRMISIEECKHGYLYFVNMRNGSVGIFNSKENSFLFIRSKFGDRYAFAESHWETGPPYGTAAPCIEIKDSGIDPSGAYVEADLDKVLDPYRRQAEEFREIREERWKEEYRRKSNESADSKTGGT